jgi:hypothetical protein
LSLSRYIATAIIILTHARLTFWYMLTTIIN